MKERRGRRRKQILDDVTSTRSSWNLKEEELDRTMWRTRFARGYSPVVGENTEWMNIILLFSKLPLCKISHITEHLFCELTHKTWLTLWSLTLKAPFLVQIPSVPPYHYPFYRHTYYVLRSYASDNSESLSYTRLARQPLLQ